MVNKFWNWMRVVLPPWWTLVIFVMVVLAAASVEWALSAYLSWHFDGTLEYAKLPTNYSGCLVIGLVAYALWKVWAFHPAWRGKYRRWLELTPWRSPKALPIGPAHLVWQDLLVVGVVTLAWTLPEDRLYLPLAFLVPYCLLITIANVRTSIDWAACGSLAILASLLLVTGQSMVMLLLALCAYFVSYVGLRRSLEIFPWSESQRWKALTLVAERMKKKKSVLWPLVHDDEYGDAHSGIRWHHVGYITLLAAWLAFCFCYFRLANASYADRLSFPRELSLMLLGFGWCCCFFRLAAYCSKHWMPISLLGRLRTGKLVIPGYDRVLVAPLLTLATSYSLPRLLIASSVPLPMVAALSVLAILLIALGMGPTLSTWHLTGKHRLYVCKPGINWVQL